MFLPSGTMCNQVAIADALPPGRRDPGARTAHILTSEGGGAGALTGAQITGLDGPRGQFDVATLQAAFRSRGSRYAPPQTLVEVEQTANLGGGTVWPLDKLNGVLHAAHENGMATHMDGARLMNAVVAAGVPAAEMVAGCDSVWLDFTKGLGAPLGAVLCGTQGLHRRARGAGSSGSAARCARPGSAPPPASTRWITTSTGWPTITPTPATLARGLAQIEGITLETPETNLVFFDTAGHRADRRRDRGARAGATA